jgi:hypothetical protein
MRVTQVFILVQFSLGKVWCVISAAATYKAGESDIKRDDLLRDWLLEHHEKLQSLRATLAKMVGRLESFGQEVEDRITSQDYLGLVRKTLRQWDQADTDEKRGLLVQLITNAGGTRVCSDDILRLFLDWVDVYQRVMKCGLQSMANRCHVMTPPKPISFGC